MELYTNRFDPLAAQQEQSKQWGESASKLFQMLFANQIAQKNAEKAATEARQGLIASQQMPESPEPAVPEVQKGYPALSALGLGKTEESTLPVAPTEEGGATTATVPSPLGMLMKNKPSPMPMTTETPAEPGVMQKLPILGGLFKKTPTVEPTTQVPTPDYVPPERAYNEQIAKQIPTGMGQDYYEKVSLYGETPTPAKVMGKAMEEAMRTGDWAKVEMLKRLAEKQNVQLVANAQGGYTAVDKNAIQPGQDVGVKRPITYAMKTALLAADDPMNPHPGKEGVFTVKVDPTSPEGGYLGIVSETTNPYEVAKARSDSYMKSRFQVVYDAQNNYAPRLRNAEQINAEPDRWLPYMATQKVLDKTALMEDMMGTIRKLRETIGTIPEFDQATATQVSEMLRHTTDKEWFGANLQNAVGKTLTPEQADYIIALAQLRENSLAVRSILNAGPGSDQLRDAILATLPRAGTPNKAYALKQIDAYEQTLARLSKGMPDISLVESNQILRGLGYTPQQIRTPAVAAPQPAPVTPTVGTPTRPAAAGNIFDQ